MLDEAERAQVGRFRFDRDRVRFVLRRAFARRVLARYLGVHPAAVGIRTSPLGRPELDPSCGLAFNTSHSDGMAVVAVAHGQRVGVDIERVREIDGALDIAEGLFEAREVEWLRSVSERMPDPACNATGRDYPSALLHEAFRAQVAGTPSAPAVRFRDEALTYEQLDRRVDDLAHRMVALGVSPGSLVAVCMERSVEMVVAVHAVLRSGGAYVPIDPEYPAERVVFMLEELDEPVLLTQQRLANRFSGAGARVVPIDLPLDEAAGLVATTLPRVSPDDLAYAIYTSGSTGRPKGALNTHRAIANRLYSMQDAYGLTPEDKSSRAGTSTP